MRTRTRTIALALLAIASPIIAQDQRDCTTRIAGHARQDGPLIIVDGQIVTGAFVGETGPGFTVRGSEGRAFGISSYSCASCRVTREKEGGVIESSFLAEPVVLSALTSSPIKAGDIIEAINDQPITSSAGATQFVYPKGGRNTMTVRRDRERVVLAFDLPIQPCAGPIRITGRAEIPGNGRTELLMKDAIFSLNPPSLPSASAAPYGFAVSCTSACNEKHAPDGSVYVTYADPPEISAIRDGSPAATIGLKVGDMVVKIDGQSIREDEAALRLFRSGQKQTLHLTVLRDGKEIGYQLQAAK